MIVMRTEVKARGLSGRKISDFMLHCTDEDYQLWWPGTHLAFHTTRHFPKELGNLIHFDEYVGKRRLKFDAVVIKNISGKLLAWQM